MLDALDALGDVMRADGAATMLTVMGVFVVALVVVAAFGRWREAARSKAAIVLRRSADDAPSERRGL